MKEQLIHILDQSVCLSRKQMKEYLSGTMLPEETHAAEVHLSSCPLCSMAMEGFEEHTDEALMAIASLNSGFLKEHFDNISPQIHLNSMAPSASLPSAQSAGRHIAMPAMWRVGSVAAAALLIFGILWAFEQRKNKMDLVPAKEMVGTGGKGNSGGSNQQSVAPMSDGSRSESGASTVTSSAAPLSNAQLPDNNNTTPPAGSVSDKNQAGATVSASTQQTGTDQNTDANNLPRITPSSADKIFKEANPLAEPEVTKKDVRKPDPEPMDNASNSDAVPAKAASAKPKENTSSTESDETTRTKESYGVSTRNIALANNKKAMASPDAEVRDKATLNVARIYIEMGETERAKELLKLLMNDGSGSYRRAARKELKKLD